MKRGDLVTVVAQGDYGKPRPALVIQSDLISLDSVVVLLVTSDLIDAPTLRIRLLPDESNGLTKPSDVMIDKILTIPRAKVGQVIGRANEETMIAVKRSLLVLLGVA